MTEALQGVAEEAVARLTELLREATVAAVVHQGRRFAIAQGTYRQALMVDTGLQARSNFFECATGRVLLAGMDRTGVDRVLARDGAPSAAVWPEARGGIPCTSASRRSGGNAW